MSCNLTEARQELDEMQKLADNMYKPDTHEKAELALDVIKRHIIEEVEKIPLDLLSDSQLKIVIRVIKGVV